jgi:glycosyltransferase 2 family protein
VPVPPSVPPPPASTQAFLRRHGGKLVASAIITLGLVYTLRKSGLPLLPALTCFEHVKWWVLPCYLASYVAASYFRATRWRFLLRSFADIPRRRILAVSWIGFAAIMLMPFRIGEVVRPYMIRAPGREEGGKLVGRVSATTATGTVLAERIVDGLYLSAVLAIALMVVPMLTPTPTHVVGLPVSIAQVRGYGYTTLGVFAVAFSTIAVFYFARNFARRVTLGVFGLVSRKLGEKLADTAPKLADGLHFLGNPRDALPFLFETSLYWGLNGLGMWLLAWGSGVVHPDGTAVTFGESCALMGMLGVTILIPGPPGLVGIFQTGIYCGLSMYFAPSVVTGEGAAFTFLLFVTQFVWQVVGAGIFLVGDRSAIRAFEEAEGIVPAPAAESETENLAT